MTERLSNKNPCNSCGADRQIGNPNRWECECDRCSKHYEWKNDCIKKLAEYETAEEEGRLVVLPCDTVWFILDEGSPYAMIMPKSIEALCLYEIKKIDKDGRYWPSKEKAEKALKEIKNGDMTYQ